MTDFFREYFHIDELENTIAKQQEQISTAEYRAQAAESRLSTAEDRAQTAENELSTAQSRLSTAENRAQTAESENARLRAFIEANGLTVPA